MVEGGDVAWVGAHTCADPPAHVLAVVAVATSAGVVLGGLVSRPLEEHNQTRGNSRGSA